MGKQIQLKVSLSNEISALLKEKAEKLGIPTTQFVKYLIIKEVEADSYPVFRASERVEKAFEEALLELDDAVDLQDVRKIIEE